MLNLTALIAALGDDRLVMWGDRFRAPGGEPMTLDDLTPAQRAAYDEYPTIEDERGAASIPFERFLERLVLGGVMTVAEALTLADGGDLPAGLAGAIAARSSVLERVAALLDARRSRDLRRNSELVEAVRVWQGLTPEQVDVVFSIGVPSS